MWIAFDRGWRNYPPDRPFDFADGMATELVRRGIARRVDDPLDDPAASAETAIAGPAMTAEKAVRRGRPRKR